jgi:hypothetical protein
LDVVLAFLSRSRYPLDYLSIEIQQYRNDEDELPRILAAILSVSTLKMVCWPQSVALLLEYLSSSPLVPRLEHLTVEFLGSVNYDILVEMLYCRRNPELGAKLWSLRFIVTNWEDLPKVPKCGDTEYDYWPAEPKGTVFFLSKAYAADSLVWCRGQSGGPFQEIWESE